MFSKKAIGSILFSILPFLSAKGYAAVKLESGNLVEKWIHGSASCSSNTDPAIQVHPYNENLTILRQSKCINYEGPFIYLFFGEKRAIMFDTGATKSASQFPIQKTVESLLVAHYGAEQRADIELVVAHTHGHGDHISGDAQFKGQPHTTLVGTTASAVSKFFGLSSWPNGSANFDLGGRVLQIVPIPGHEPSHIAIYDEQTGILISGDTLYPGRLYVSDWASYRQSVARLTAFLADKDVTHVLGAHIEMSTSPGVDYPIGSTYQPKEHDLPLTKDSLDLLNTRLLDLGAFPQRDIQDDFIIYPI